MHQRRSSGSRQHAGPAVEQLQHLGSGLDLGRRGNAITASVRRSISWPNSSGCAAPCRRAPGTPCCRRLRPCRRPESRARRQSRSASPRAAALPPAAAASHRPGPDERETGPGRARRDPASLVSGSSFGPSPSTKRDIGAQRVRNDEDIREQDRRIEAVAPDRLQRDLDRQLRRVAQVQKVRDHRRNARYSGQIAARLAHQPDRRAASTDPAPGRPSSGFWSGGELTPCSVDPVGASFPAALYLQIQIHEELEVVVVRAARSRDCRPRPRLSPEIRHRAWPRPSPADRGISEKGPVRTALAAIWVAAQLICG